MPETKELLHHLAIYVYRPYADATFLSLATDIPASVNSLGLFETLVNTALRSTNPETSPSQSDKKNDAIENEKATTSLSRPPFVPPRLAQTVYVVYHVTYDPDGMNAEPNGWAAGIYSDYYLANEWINSQAYPNEYKMQVYELDYNKPKQRATA